MKNKQYLVKANLVGYKIEIGFLTTAKTAKEALKKTQDHINTRPLNEDGQVFAKVKNRCRVAKEKDIKTFENFPDSILI